ncbi:hypothetical protein JCM11251_001893 [Rhodosporidiobolus azoricus]
MAAPSIPSPVAAAPTAGLPPFASPPPESLVRQTSRRSTSAKHWAAADAPASSAHDLPEKAAMAALERTPSQASVRSAYVGGAGLGRGQSRRGPLIVGTTGGREERIEEDVEGGVLDEEVAVGETGEAVGETVDHAQRMYARFSDRQKSLYVAIVSYAALLAPFSSSSFLPSIPQISEELNTTPSIINVTVAIFILVIGLVPLIWAPYAGVYGRRPVYIVSLPIFALGSMGCALSRTLAQLIVTRIIQGIGSCSVLSVGAGTIGDLYPKEVRGQAMGLFYLGILIGPATAPAIAGILTEYAHPIGQGWRAMQWLLFAMGVLASLLVFFFFPETAHARGIDLIRRERLEARAEKEEVDPDQLAEREREERSRMGWLRRKWSGFVWVWCNPLAPLRLLVHPNILAMSINSSFVLSVLISELLLIADLLTVTSFSFLLAVLVPLSQTVAPRYNISNAAILGCFYLSQGLGNAVASRYTGRFADWTLARWLRKRNGVYVAEDRLKATLWGGGLILPGSVLALGWVLDRVGGKVGLAWTIILLFIDGVGLMIVLTPCNTYVVDCAGVRSSEAIAVNNACRYVLSAAASAFVLPMIQAIGVGPTNTFAAGIVLLGFGIVLLLIRYGGKMRELGANWDGEALLKTGGSEGEKEIRGSGASGASTVVEAGEGGRESGKAQKEEV